MSEIKNIGVFSDEGMDMDDSELNQLIDSTVTEIEDGELVSGTVVKIEHDEVLVDIGYKSEGVIPARELSIRKDLDPGEIVQIGDPVEALVLTKEDKDGRLILSKKRAEYERAWINIEEKFNSAENVTGEVIEVVKGGLIIDIGLRGFLPASLVDLRRVKDLESFTGETIEARVIEMDRHRNNVVLSRRVVLEEGRKNERNEILEKLAKGMRLKGVVSSIVDFGVFVDLGGIDGLVHISELSWSHVSHPSEVVKVGDEVEVEVLDVDLSRERISLGLKQTTDDPWQQLVKSFPPGQIVDGRVTKLVNFGTFVELGDNVEGLVHISEMAARHIETASQVVHVGDLVKVKVMDIDPERRRISLSMKAAADELGFEIEVQEPDPNAPKPKPKTRKSRDGQSDEAGEETGEESAEADGAAEAAVEGPDSDGDTETEAGEEATPAEVSDAASGAGDVADAESKDGAASTAESTEGSGTDMDEKVEQGIEEAKELTEEAQELGEAIDETVKELVEAAETKIEEAIEGPLEEIEKATEIAEELEGQSK